MTLVIVMNAFILLISYALYLHGYQREQSEIDEVWICSKSSHLRCFIPMMPRPE